MAHRAERTVALLLALAAATLAAAGCGSSPSYGERAQDACATASPRTAADARRTAADARAALVQLRRVDPPKDDAQHRTAHRLVTALGEQQHALDRLAAALRDHAAPATLRDLAQTAAEQGTAVKAPARALGAPACGAAGSAVAAQVHAQDYAATLHRTADELTYAERRVPHLRSADHARLVADTDRASDTFDQLAARLEPLQPPPGAAPEHGRLLAALYALRDQFTAVGDRVRHGSHLDLAAALARHRDTYNKAQDDWRALAAKLPRVPATGSPWGDTDGRRAADAALRTAYVKTMREELFALNSHRPPGRQASAAQWRRIGRVVERARSRLVDLRAPAAVAPTQRLMLQGFTSLARTASTIAGALTARSYPQALRAERLARRGLRQLRLAQRRFRAAGYRFNLGVGGSGGGGSSSSAPPNTTLS